jgi:hypothetical protein
MRSRLSRGMLDDLKHLVEADTLGDPVRPLLWVSKSLEKLSSALADMGHSVSPNTVRMLLVTKLGFSRQSNRKADEGTNHPDRNAQFEYINAQVLTVRAASEPVISVDTKRKELVGNYRNAGSGSRVRLWKVELQKLADDTNLTIKVRHYPSGTSKWNKIEHRLFCHITQNKCLRRGRRSGGAPNGSWSGTLGAFSETGAGDAFPHRCAETGRAPSPAKCPARSRGSRSPQWKASAGPWEPRMRQPRPSAPPWAPPHRDRGRTYPLLAELLGTDTDSERAIQWLIALMVLCCDPLA